MSASLITRFPENPILTPSDVPPSRPGMTVEAVLNPGAFRHRGRTGLLLRVAERPVAEKNHIAAALRDADSPDGLRIINIRLDDPALQYNDPRGFTYKNRYYLTTLSHLRLAWSDDGVHFAVEPLPALQAHGDHETYGIEDCRVEFMDNKYWLAYALASENGVGVGLASTPDWKTYERHGIIFSPHNKDAALFPEKIGGYYYAFHRPSGIGLGGNNIWLARSPDLLHWGAHRRLIAARPGQWDGERIGAGAAPIKTPRGWLSIYHGADATGRYCLGALLLAPDDPARVLARSTHPLLEPEAECEKQGFYGNCVFTNGHVTDGDTLTLYYGASDSVVCGARASINAILDSL
ncbi:MAG: glycoside hydrolase family 130 protein [Opitutaceae bacterium]|jgi:predicted GH43/DUF377 family glycosyl hydrolase|nr:glycoside hydrolase family 130 protein [Opitutaceae bacterium]